MDHPRLQTGPDGSLLLNFGEYGEEVEVAAISGDGRRVLTVREVGVAEIWDTTSGSRVGELRPEVPLQGTIGTSPAGDSFQVFIESAALNRDGSTALLGLNDGTAGTFRVSDGARLATLHRPAEPAAATWSVIRAVAFSPDGTLALVGFAARAAGVWSESGDRLVAFLDTPHGSKLVGAPFVRDTLVSSIAMTPDNRFLFAGHADMTATIWDVNTGEVVFAATEHAEAIVALFDHRDGFGWATTRGSVWSSRDDAPPTNVLRTGEHWAEARFRGAELLTRTFGGEITHRHVPADGQPAIALSKPSPGMWSTNAETLDFRDAWMLYPEGGTRVAARRGTDVVTIDCGAQLVTARFSPDGTAFATTGWKDEVELWSLPTGKLVHTFASPGGVGDFAFSPDSALIAIGEIGHGGGRYARQVHIYDTQTGRRSHGHTEHDWQVAHVEFSPDGASVASLADEIVLWDLERRRVRARIAADRTTTRLRFLPDGRLLVLRQGRVQIYREDRIIREWEAPVRFRTRWCISDDARTLNIALDQAVIRFDVETGAVRGTWAAPMPKPDRVPDAALDKQVEARSGAAIWRTEHGTFLHQGDGPRGWMQPLHLSPSGIVVVPTENGAAVIRVSAGLALLCWVPFEGKLRASRVVDSEVLLVNEQGALFRHRVEP